MRLSNNIYNKKIFLNYDLGILKNNFQKSILFLVDFFKFDLTIHLFPIQTNQEIMMGIKKVSTFRQTLFYI
mgnify:CR=1 FL=1